jgi:uncharacterized membrane protein
MSKEAQNYHKTENEISLERIVFFSDAVFAIAITLLALEIRLPAEISGVSNGDLFQNLLSIWPKYLGYLVSFLSIGNFWVVHHRQFRYIERFDTGLMFINLLILMAVAFMPFPTAVISGNGNRTATIFYAFSAAFVGLLSAGLWIYATSRNRLVSSNLGVAITRRGMLRSLSAPVVFLLSIGLAFINADLAKFSWILIMPAVLLVR